MLVKVKNEAGEEVVIEATPVETPKAETETVDKETVENVVGDMVTDAVSKALSDGSIADKIAEKINLTKTVTKSAEPKAKEALTADTETRDFVKALLSNDTAKLKSMSTSTSDDAKAGYTVPTQLLAEILRLKTEYGVARREMRYLPFSGAGNSRDIPALSGAVATFWTDEGAEKAGTQGTFRKVKQELKKLASIVALTDELIEDSAIDLTALMAELFVEAITKEEDVAFFTGTGTPFTGVLNATTGLNPVPTFTLGAGKDTFAEATADDYLDLQYKVATSARNTGKYYLHPTVIASVMKLKDTTGNYIYASAINGRPATLWGKPVVEVEAMPSTSTASQADKPFVVFGDLKQACVYGDKGEMQMKLLDQATIDDVNGDPINLAQRDMTGIRVVQRVGYAIVLPTAIAVMKTIA